ncbi:PAS domain-containing sensor histidine kinase [Nocardioides piscis]|uniref:histidine kinase n=1 Tax=Nocardioides piscis TaxID=2714938 RepID=A0A6G7YD84_9ACTN|nr:HAMP domain-containing sensor histidine kinase [Nocardioides piscis]QIK74598.1 HAMP domain-containing histidine kinase [Nocardioides piscis]
MTPPTPVGEESDVATRYQALIEQHPNAVFGLDVEGRFVEVNPAAGEVSGYEPEQLVGMHFADLLEPDDMPMALEAFTQALAGTPQRIELPIRRQDGGSVHLGVTTIPWIVAGEIRGVYGMAEDNRTAQDLEVVRHLAVAASQAKSDFVARMSHEMRTPLTSILATVDLLSETTTGPERELVATLQRSSTRLLTLVDDVLDFAAAGQAKQLAEFDLHQLIHDTVAQVEPTARAKGLTLRVDICDDVPRRIKDHPIWLGQVLGNVLGNAVDYTERGSVDFTITTTPSASADLSLVYRVRDTGVGIDPAFHELVFEPFTRAPNAASTKAAHTGLGLSIVKQLVTIAGGSIALDSAPGRGSTFLIVMPAAPVGEEPREGLPPR